MKSILMKLFIIGLFVSFFPIQAMAEGFTDWNKVKEVYQRECTESRGFEVTLETKHANPDECEKISKIDVPCRERSYRTIVAIFLEAFEEGYEVDAFVQGCDEDGDAIVKAVKMRKPEEEPPQE